MNESFIESAIAIVKSGRTQNPSDFMELAQLHHVVLKYHQAIALSEVCCGNAFKHYRPNDVEAVEIVRRILEGDWG